MKKATKRRVRELRSLAANLLRVANEIESENVEEIVASARARPADEAWANVNRELILTKTIELYKERRRRIKHFPSDLFGEPAWDILLDLFSARLQNKQISVTSACLASSVPNTTGLRWLSELEELGFIERINSEADRRVSWVKLTDSANTSMLEYLNSIEDIKRHPEFDLESYLIDDRDVDRLSENSIKQEYGVL